MAATNNLAQFAELTRAIVDTNVLEARHILRTAIVDAWAQVLARSPEADPDYAGGGRGRYKASNHIAKGAPGDNDGAPKGATAYAEPGLSEGQAVASETELGDEVWLWNDMGFGEMRKSRSIAFFIEVGTPREEPRPVYFESSEATEEHLNEAVDAFNAKVIE
jgi:hypothetical protein